MADQRPIGYWLKLVDRLLDEQFAETLDEHGITRRQWQLLSVLSRGAASIEALDVAIAPFLATTPVGGEGEAATSAEHLTELIESAWVDATPTGYELTDRGRAAFDRLAVVVGEQRTCMTVGITEAEYVATIAVLERMAGNLGWRDDA